MDSKDQATVDKRFGKLEARIAALERWTERHSPDPDAREEAEDKRLFGLKVQVRSDLKDGEWGLVSAKPAVWSNHEQETVRRWTRKDADTLLNRYRIQWKIKDLDERHMCEIHEDDTTLYTEVSEQVKKEKPDLYARISKSVESEHADQITEGNEGGVPGD